MGFHRCLCVTFMLLRFASCSLASIEGFDDPNAPRMGSRFQRRSSISPKARRSSKSIFDLNSEHFKKDNFHSHLVKLTDGQTFSLGYHSVGAYNITWGDVIVDPTVIHATVRAERESQQQAALLGLDEARLDASHPAAVDLMGIVISSSQRRWPCPIPVVISEDLQDQNRVIEAIEMIENSTHWRFVQRSTETDYIVVVQPTEDVCASLIGRVRGAQEILLGPGCTAGSAAHEFMHAMGIYHEHTAANRDEYVRILTGNIRQEEGILINFQIQDDQIQVGDYDFNSIMHYGPTDFSPSQLSQTIQILDEHLNSTCGIGQREELSFGDVSTIAALYGVAPAYGSICPSPDEPIPDYPQCVQQTELRICGRQSVLSEINGKYIEQADTFNDRPVFLHKGGRLFLYYSQFFGAWVINLDSLDENRYLARSFQKDLNPRFTTEWEVVDADSQARLDPLVFGALCDFGDDGAIWEPGQVRPTFQEFDGSSRLTVSTLRLVSFIGTSLLLGSLRC